MILYTLCAKLSIIGRDVEYVFVQRYYNVYVAKQTGES